MSNIKKFTEIIVGGVTNFLRIASDGTVTLAGNAGDIVLMTYGCHYEVDSFGSSQITTK